MTSKVELSTVINRPIDEVFKNATCLRGCVNWQTAIISTEKLDAGPTEVGSRFYHIVKFMGMKTETHPEVLRIDPPYEFAYADPDARIPFETRFLFKEVPGGTELTVILDEDIQEGVIGMLRKPILERATVRQWEADLASLKDLLEHGITVHAQD